MCFSSRLTLHAWSEPLLCWCQLSVWSFQLSFINLYYYHTLPKLYQPSIISTNFIQKSVFINIGRGDVVSEETIITAIRYLYVCYIGWQSINVIMWSRNGWLGGAILDVFEKEPLPEDSELWRMPEVIITPHIAGPCLEDMVREEYYIILCVYSCYITELNLFPASKPSLCVVFCTIHPPCSDWTIVNDRTLKYYQMGNKSWGIIYRINKIAMHI